MDKNNPLDYLTENIDEPVFGESSVGEVTLPGEADIDSLEFELTGDGGMPEPKEGAHEEHEESETPGEEALEHSSDPRDIISELQRKISELKEDITSKLKPSFPEDKKKDLAEALDDATSALDLCSHHLTDVDNELSDESSEDFEDVTMPGGEGSSNPEGTEVTPEEPLVEEPSDV